MKSFGIDSLLTPERVVLAEFFGGAATLPGVSGICTVSFVLGCSQNEIGVPIAVVGRRTGDDLRAFQALPDTRSPEIKM